MSIDDGDPCHAKPRPYPPVSVANKGVSVVSQNDCAFFGCPLEDTIIPCAVEFDLPRKIEM
jgi:hypothetical protein